MKRFILFLTFCSSCFVAESQIFIPQLYVGQNINQVIYNGTYTSTTNCTAGQDYDFNLTYPQVVPFATGVDITVEITSLTGSATLNGNAVSQGTTFQLVQPVIPLKFQFTSAGTMNFSIHASGTPTIAAETYPCYVVEKVSQFTCNNTYTLMEGEVFVPCTVATATGISEQGLLQNIFFNQENQLLSVETKNADELIVTDVLGKIILSQQLKKGKHSISMWQFSGGVYIARVDSRSKPLKFAIR
jgi:hypothetical protein